MNNHEITVPVVTYEALDGGTLTWWPWMENTDVQRGDTLTIKAAINRPHPLHSQVLLFDITDVQVFTFAVPVGTETAPMFAARIASIRRRPDTDEEEV